MQLSAELRWFWPYRSKEIERWFTDFDFAAGGGRERVDEYVIDQIELGAKLRGSPNSDGMAVIEVKGLIDRRTPPIKVGTMVGSPELWGKWKSNSLLLHETKRIRLRKIRWLRKFEVAQTMIRELRLDETEQLLEQGSVLPSQGCNVELCAVNVQGDSSTWLTVGFEAFGPLDSVETVLRLTADHISTICAPTFEKGEEFSYPAWIAQRRDSI